MALHPQLDELIDQVMNVVRHFHRQSMFAPHAATVNRDGQLMGSLLTDNGTTHLTVTQAIDHFEDTFRIKAEAGEIVASGIFYHASGMDVSSSVLTIPPAVSLTECRAVVGLLEHASGESVYLYIIYSGSAPDIEYAVGKLIQKPPKVFKRAAI